MDALDKIIAHIARGEVVAIPTDTVYGLVCDASNDDAIQQLYALKGRSQDVPLQVLVADLDMAQHCGVFHETALQLAKNHWPGALTMVVERAENAPISPLISAEKGTVGLRMPDAEIVAKLLNKLQKPLAASSANPTGKATPTNISEVLTYFNDIIHIDNDDLVGGQRLHRH